MHGAGWTAELVKRRLVEAVRDALRTARRPGAVLETRSGGQLIATDGKAVSGWRLVQAVEFVLADGEAATWGKALMTYARLKADIADMAGYYTEAGIARSTFYAHVDKGANAVAVWLNARARAHVSKTEVPDEAPGLASKTS